MAITINGSGITSANIADGTITNSDINSTSTGLDDVSGVARATSGLLFNGDTASANALDDYEEGTWTPTADSGCTGVTIGSTARYVKIGRQVTVSWYISAITGTSANQLRIGGLPFSIPANYYATSGVEVGTTLTEGIVVRGQATTSTLRFYLSSGDIFNGSSVTGHTIGAITYII